MSNGAHVRAAAGPATILVGSRPSRRVGRPSLLSAVTGTSVIAGTATMTSHAIQPAAWQQAGEPDLIDRLCRLAELRASGDLNDWEFEMAKGRLLA